MFSRQDPTIAYLIGIIIFFFIIVYFAINIYIPFLNSPSTFRFEIDGSKISPPQGQYYDNGIDIKARINTSKGIVTIDLYETSAPKNVNNFIHLAKNQYYDGTKFHRAVNDFMIQGGDRNSINQNSISIGKGNTGYFIQDEVNWDSLDLSKETRDRLSYEGYTSTAALETPLFAAWTIAMASSGPNTNSSQFFIILNVKNDDSRLKNLDGKFTPIGKIISGFEVVDIIENDISIIGVMPVINSIEIYI